jgi:signal transduction histidine kinase
MLNAPPAISIHVEGVDALSPVVGEAGSMALLFLNLLENAVSAMAGHGTIRVQGSEAVGAVRVVVTDSGPGIARELRDRIFEFNHSGRTGKFGFGLWWVRTHMTRLGGAVHVDGDGPGACFRLVFPVPEGTP